MRSEVWNFQISYERNSFPYLKTHWILVPTIFTHYFFPYFSILRAFLFHFCFLNISYQTVKSRYTTFKFFCVVVLGHFCKLIAAKGAVNSLVMQANNFPWPKMEVENCRQAKNHPFLLQMCLVCWRMIISPTCQLPI